MKERKYYLDILRILACFCVLVNHTNNLVFQWQVPAFSETWYVSIVYFFAVKVAVPIYLMISGALLLQREESYKDVFLKRFLPPAIAVFFASMFYFWQRPDYYGEFSIPAFLERIYTRRISNAFWYMYMYLGLILLLPVLRKAVKMLQERDFLYLAGLHAVVLGVIPMLERYAGWPKLSEHFPLAFLSVYIIYFFMGHYMEHVMPKKRLNLLGAIVAIVVYLVTTLVPAWLTVQEYAETGSFAFYMDNVSRITIVAQTYAVFYLGQYLFDKKKRSFRSGTKKVLAVVSSCTFGIYLLSDWLIWELEVFYDLCTGYMNRIPAVVLFELAIFAVGFLITWILKKIPLAKNVL